MFYASGDQMRTAAVDGADPTCFGWGSKEGLSHYARHKVPRRWVRVGVSPFLCKRKMEIR